MKKLFLFPSLLYFLFLSFFLLIFSNSLSAQITIILEPLKDNLIIDNRDSSGIWYDVGNVDGLFINNWIENTDNGFFFEIS